MGDMGDAVGSKRRLQKEETGQEAISKMKVLNS